jgi:hypothetical protein
LWHLGRHFIVETDFARVPRRALAKGTAAQTGRRSRAKSTLPQFLLSGELDALKCNQRLSKLRGLSYKFGITSLPGIAGSFNGSFYGPAAANTGGNFNFHTTVGPTYLISGIFAAKR